MALEHKVVKDVFDEIQNQDDYSNIYRLTVDIITEKFTITTSDIVSCVVTGDFSSDFGETIMLHVRVMPSELLMGIMPNKDKLKIRLNKTIKVRTDNVTFGKTTYDIYTATLAKEFSVDELALSSMRQPDQISEIDSQGPVDVVFQLQEATLEISRLTQLGNVFRDATVENIIRVVMAPELIGNRDVERLKSEGYPGLRGVDIIKPTNQKKYEYILIPPTIRIPDIPGYLQKELGVYATGIGSFIKRGVWYIFPLVSTALYGKTERSMTVYLLAENELTTPEKSFISKGRGVHILSSSNLSVVDNSEEFMHNVGNGMRFMRASALMDGLVTVTGNKLEFKRDENYKEFILKERSNGLTNAPIIQELWTDNPYPQTSILSRGLSKIVDFKWESSNPDKIFPGMPVKLNYVVGGELKSIVGTIMGYATVYEKTSTKTLENSFVPNTTIRIIAE